MTITISSETERIVQEELGNGHFRSVDDLIVNAVKAWREKHFETVAGVSSGDGGAMLKIDGLWVHQGQAELGADWDQLVSNVREERITDLLKASLQ